MKFRLTLCFLAIAMLSSQAQVSVAKEKPGMKSDPVPRSDDSATKEERPTLSDRPTAEEEESRPEGAAPRNIEESSSRDTIIDLSPPRNDNKRTRRYDDDEEDNTGVGEFKPWNPHRALKSIEVGEYYFKQKNYAAAISRFREALEYKPKDAKATFRLAESLEKTGQDAEALQNYEEYLKILKRGPFAEDAKKAIERLRSKSADAS
jgi:tetratricopeptide (TPR) repeat protein